MRKIKLVQDNNWNNHLNKKGIEIDKDILEYELPKFFSWRTPTKRFNTFTQRYFKLGSTEFDNFINYMVDNKGYWLQSDNFNILN